MTPKRGALLTLLAAFVAFCIVQDLGTAAGANEYARLQRQALDGRAPQVTVDQVMKPAIARSVRDGLLSAAGVALVGVAVSARSRRSSS